MVPRAREQPGFDATDEAQPMQYVCDAGTKTWFRLESEREAERESREMDHAVEKYFRRCYADAEPGEPAFTGGRLDPLAFLGGRRLRAEIEIDGRPGLAGL